jgi:hypothetical protein
MYWLMLVLLAGCTPQYAALASSLTAQGANFLFEQERMAQQAQMQREQERERQQMLYLQYMRSQQQP